MHGHIILVVLFRTSTWGSFDISGKKVKLFNIYSRAEVNVDFKYALIFSYLL